MASFLSGGDAHKSEKACQPPWLLHGYPPRIFYADRGSPITLVATHGTGITNRLPQFPATISSISLLTICLQYDD